MRIACTKDSIRIYLNGQRYEHWHLDDNYIFRDEDYAPINIYEMARLCRRTRSYIKGLIDSSSVMAGKFVPGITFSEMILILGDVRIMEAGNRQIAVDPDGLRLSETEAARGLGVPVQYINGIIDGSRNMRGIVKRGLVG